MAGSINKVILVGHVGKDPEIRMMPDGTRLASFSLATSESWKDRATGEKKERTEWSRISIFNDRLSEICEKYVRKGSRLYLEGQLQTRKWTDQQGVERYTTEVVLSKFKGELTLLDSKGASGGDDYDSSSYGESSSDFGSYGSSGSLGSSPSPSASQPAFGQINDDMPF